MTLQNVLRQALNPARFRVMAKKLGRRLVDRRGRLSSSENMVWIRANCSNLATFAAGLDADIWRESEAIAKSIEARADRVLPNTGYDLRCGGAYPFLYFVARFLKPNCIVETGVAAGYSSQALLRALARNGRGRLYSSDFPYVRLPNPERFIGALVEDSLKANWRLYLNGDDDNLPRILSEIGEIDVFHYDSDKSYSGRSLAMSLIEHRISRNGVFLMDDIQDNSFFHDYVVEHPTVAWRVFEFHKKYLGMIGHLDPGERQLAGTAGS